MKGHTKEKKRAHASIYRLNKWSKWKKPAGMTAHHWAYNNKWRRSVIWLTAEEHIEIHKFISYDDITMKYRPVGEDWVLNTRKKHICFIAPILGKSYSDIENSKGRTRTYCPPQL